MQTIRIVTGGDIPVPSYIDSWQFWREQWTGEDGVPWGRLAKVMEGREVSQKNFIDASWDALGKESSPVCTICGGNTEFMSDAGRVWCFCEMLRKRELWRSDIKRYGSQTSRKFTFDTYKVTAGRGSDESSRMLEAAKLFVADPSRWIVFCGYPGTGKTHLLQAIAHESKIAMYVAMPDITQVFMTAAGDKTVDDVVRAMSYVPVLILDDYGREYSNSEFVENLLFQIINRRYSDPQEYPIVMASNMKPEMLASDALGSRLTDKAIARVVTSFNLPDYRQKAR